MEPMNTPHNAENSFAHGTSAQSDEKVATSRNEQKKPSIPSVWTQTGAMWATLAILCAVVFGLVFETTPRASVNLATPSSGESQNANILPTGETTEVEVQARADMTFSPNRIEVPAGNELIVTLVNTDPVSGHDLVIGDSATPRVQPGKSAQLNAGVMRESTMGHCSVAGHEQMGMTLEIVVTSASSAKNESMGDSHDHSSTANSASGAHHAMPVNIADVSGAKLSHHIDPMLKPLEPNTGSQTRKVTLRVQEVNLEVSPGLYQRRWTFNGESVAPTLHGRVGDTFVVTLINDGSMGHSIDFHAGAVAPDQPMRTIKPGESLEYVFKAERAGIWMYHCSTMPMSTHIAAGMHGAVVIEPPDLEPVDASYVLVQSEVYLANAAHNAESAKELDAQKILAGTPDRVVFNGISDQYLQYPIQVKPNQRVRFWVLNAGPDQNLAFHVVGGQFDTTWTEGAYLIHRGVASSVGSVPALHDVGAQVLPLQPAQGGFVELTFAQTGHYKAVNHVMSVAERGARVTIEVQD
ncbi:multicopper oxidase domain-containing protein [Arcanobacterium bovis]|uniref:Copper-containing nitrite reductase n=1 Tax=Arcanobacterium bovis TaxID=2529275 RepID=A0A4Q9V243_9ACTO|nr:multicopper oxidase domain-containing protein [Arcanobacterium bovis]TBW22105.1 copper oxidase [Arcanobacterium bovis]